LLYDHSLRIPQLFSGPGIAAGSKLDFRGTQVMSHVWRVYGLSERSACPGQLFGLLVYYGIITNRQLRHTQVDIAPTILGLAGIATPVTMDGRSIVALLVTKPAEAPASVQHHLTAQEPGPAPVRAYSFHEYYNQVQWLRHQS